MYNTPIDNTSNIPIVGCINYLDDDTHSKIIEDGLREAKNHPRVLLYHIYRVDRYIYQ